MVTALRLVWFGVIAFEILCGADLRAQTSTSTSSKLTQDSTLIAQTGMVSRSYHQCADSIASLVSSSNMLELSKLKSKWWKKQWKDRGRFTTEFHDDGLFWIHTYLAPEGPETGEFTIAWLAVDKVSRSMKLQSMANESEMLLVRCNPGLLRFVIEHCIDWKNH